MLPTANGHLQRLSGAHPFLFASLITALLLVIYVVAAIAAALAGDSLVSRNLIEALVRLVGALLFLVIILRFGWQEPAGLNRLGSAPVWLLTAIILAYEAATYAFPYLGGTDWAAASLADTAAVALNAMTTGPLEEFPFRGLILCAFVLRWVGDKGGLGKAVLLSAVFFGASHLVHILWGRPAPRATLIAVNAGLSGIYYAAILLRWRTIWPAVALHSGLNTLATIIAFNTPGFTESVPGLLTTIAFQIPLAILGWLLIVRQQGHDMSPRAA